ncbi:hypothetical protein ACQ33O_12690 [Ferruginibacter sp. SUN002]|uniref:DUF7935 family protein n=1 Tax=Ferruginibacter sp. SUN002 TaxID=2937789 RepID=UPI003D36F2BC
MTFLFEVGFNEGMGIAVVVIFGFIFFLMLELKAIRRELKAKQPTVADNGMLRLQAYERLSLLADRITLKNLVSRTHSTGYTVEELKAGLTETIRQEYEHNITQQIYVNPEVWKAVTNLKEQNIYIINQLATAIPPQAPAVELSKLILEYTSNNNAELSGIVLDAIQFEVKKLL